MPELPHDVIVILLGSFFRITTNGLDKAFQVPFQQLVNLAIVVVVMSDTIHAVDVIPNRPSEHGRVDVIPIGHAVKFTRETIKKLTIRMARRNART